MYPWTYALKAMVAMLPTSAKPTPVSWSMRLALTSGRHALCYYSGRSPWSCPHRGSPHQLGGDWLRIVSHGQATQSVPFTAIHPTSVELQPPPFWCGVPPGAFLPLGDVSVLVVLCPFVRPSLCRCWPSGRFEASVLASCVQARCLDRPGGTGTYSSYCIARGCCQL